MDKKIFFRVTIQDPLKILQKSILRNHYFIVWERNRADDLKCIFTCGKLYLAAPISKEDAAYYSKMFFEYATAGARDEEGQRERFQAIEKKFGEDGIDTASEMFEYYRGKL